MKEEIEVGEPSGRDPNPCRSSTGACGTGGLGFDQHKGSGLQSGPMPPTGGSEQSHTLGNTNASIWLGGGQPPQSSGCLLPLDPEGMAPGNAERAVFVLLFLLLSFKDSSWGGVAV
jgi:hypothetical protein